MWTDGAQNVYRKLIKLSGFWTRLVTPRIYKVHVERNFLH